MDTQSKPKAETQRKNPDQAEDDEQADNRADMSRAVQKLINTMRKAEGRLRRGEEELESLEARWKTYQIEMKQSFINEFIKERAKFLDRMKNSEDAKERRQACEEALSELQETLVHGNHPKNTHEDLIDRDAENDWATLLGGGPVADEGELSDILAGALAASSDCQSTMRWQLLRLIANHKGALWRPIRRSDVALVCRQCHRLHPAGARRPLEPNGAQSKMEHMPVRAKRSRTPIWCETRGGTPKGDGGPGRGL